jgi:hypothetical protein
LKINGFPRKLTDVERKILFSLLPDNKIGYNNYRSLIENFYLIAEGRFGNGNLILGEIGNTPDFSIPSSPVFAIGNVFSAALQYYVVIHTIDDGLIEIQMDPYPVKAIIKIDKVVSYSNWIPGMESPEKNSKVYEYSLKENEFLLAVCPDSKKIWLHDYRTGVNNIIPISNFFNELMLIRNIKDEKSLQSPSIFFNEIESYPDRDIKLAFLLYNKYLKRFDLGDTFENLVSEKQKKNRSFKLFGRGIN